VSLLAPIRSPKEARHLLWGTFAASVVVRALLVVSGFINVEFITGDSPEYMKLADSLLRYRVFGFDGVPKMNRTPGFPAFLALLEATIGLTPLAVITVQTVMDALSCVMVVHLALRARMSRLAALVTAAMAATCIYTSSRCDVVMTEVLYTFLGIASLWVLPVGPLGVVLRRSSLKRLAIAGLLVGLATLVRPTSIFLIVVVPAAILLPALVRRWSTKRLLRAVVVGTVFAGCGATMVVPWMARNRIVFAFEFEKPVHDHVTLLGYWSDVRVFRHWYTPEFSRFHRSYEEPFIMEVPFRGPSVARYVYDGEREDVAHAFVDLEKEIQSIKGAEPVTDATLSQFKAIADKRYEAAPRIRFTAPLSRVVKLWISPRVSQIWQDSNGGSVSRWALVGWTLYNCVYVLPGLLGLLLGPRRAAPAWLAMLAVVVSQTAFYAFWHASPDSRYMVPFFPFLCLGCGLFVNALVDPKLRPTWLRRGKPSVASVGDRDYASARLRSALQAPLNASLPHRN
jgi:hypothetical protein